MKRNLFIIIFIAFSQTLFCQEWTVPVDIGRTWWFSDNIPVDGGDSALGVGSTTNQDGFVVKIGKDGEYIDRVVHLPDTTLRYISAVQLDNGNYMVFGVCSDSIEAPNYHTIIRMDVFDAGLEHLGSKRYDINDGQFECFIAANLGLKVLRAALSPSGTVILAAAQAYNNGSYYSRALVLYELDREGNMLSMKPHPSDYAASIEEITYEPHSGNLLVAVYGGSFPNNTGVPGIYVIDTNLEVVAKQDLRKVQGGWGFEVDPIYEISTDGRWIDGDRLIINTLKSLRNRMSFYYASMYVVDSALNVYAELRLPPYDSCTSIPRGTSTAYINDSTIFAVTYCSETIYDNIEQTNVILVDKHLNLLGRKALKDDGFMFLPGQPAAFNDGGCLLPITINEPGNPEFEGMLMKFRREDIEITWDVVEEEGERAELSPYPNPCNGTVNIPLTGSVTGNARILLFDSGGVKCLDNTIGQAGNLIRLDTGNLAPGLYVYRIINGNSTIAEGKFVKAS